MVALSQPDPLKTYPENCRKERSRNSIYSHDSDWHLNHQRKEHNRITSGELLSNDRRVVGFRSSQLGLSDALALGGGVSGIGLGWLAERGCKWGGGANFQD